MTDGRGSTLIIHPKGLADVTMSLDAIGTYYVPLQTLDFNEELRWQAIYNEAPPGEGGEVVGGTAPLVSITFQCRIRGATRDAMILAYNTLAQALINQQGGTIQYKPDDAAAGVLSTYYHYVQSAPPKMIDQGGNRWDAGLKQEDQKYSIWVEVEFKTQPIATSNPASPVTLAEMSVIANSLTVSAVNVSGSMPALLRFLVRPGSGETLGRVIVFKRDEGTLANFTYKYEAEAATVIYPSIAWTAITDATRSGSSYYRCLPPEDANGMAQGIKFTILNATDCEGRFAVFGIGYDDADTVGTWKHQVKLLSGNVVQEGRSDYEAESLHSWQLVYAGEFELPLVPFSDSEAGYSTGPFLEWYSTRSTGVSEFRLDYILLVYVSDSKWNPTALDVQCADEGGVTNSEQLLVENFIDDWGRIREMAHVVAQSDGDFKRALLTAPRGDFLMLDPGKDTLLVFVKESVSGNTILDDDFESYKGSRWLPIADFETDETWTTDHDTIAADTTYKSEGSQGISMAPVGPGEAYAQCTMTKTLNLEDEGRFTDDDFCVIWGYIPDATNIVALAFRFRTTAVNYYTAMPAVVVNGESYINKKNAFGVLGSPDWANITGVSIWVSGTATPATAYFDCWRLEKADPDDATNPNATGNQWNFQPVGGHWTITEDMTGAGATLACLDAENSVEKCALIDETTPNDVMFRARVSDVRGTGIVGLVFRSGQDTLTVGAEDCYMARLLVGGGAVYLYRYVNGASTLLSETPFVAAVSAWYTMGVIVQGSSIRVYVAATADLDDDDDVFSAANLQISTTDTTYTTGQCGVVSFGSLGRFDNVKLVSLQDKVVPADAISLEGKAIFRTIAPFAEA